MRDVLRMTLALVIAALSGPLAAEDAPAKTSQAITAPESWPNFRNGNQQLGVAHAALPEKLELLWTLDTDYGVTATAAIVEGKVYVPTVGGWLHCLEKQTGKEVWKYRSIDDPDPKAFAPGFKSAPLATKSAVFVGDEDGVLHAVDRATGKRLWQFKTDAEIAGCPTLAGEKLIVPSHDSFLYCLNVTNGHVIWKFQTEDRINCSPAVIGNHTFIAGCDAHLRVIDIDTGQEVRAIPLESYLVATPAVIGEILYVGTHAGEVLAVNWNKSEIVWRFKDKQKEFPFHSSAAVTDQFVFVGGQDKMMHCLKRETGEEVWNFRTRAQILSSAVVAGNRLFFGCHDGNLYGLDLKDGTEVWRYNVGSDIGASPAVGEGVLVIGAEEQGGKVYCFGQK